MQQPDSTRQIATVILAAGRGTRMGETDRPKVCFPIEGVPAVARAIATYHRCGLGPHLLVVGPGAEQVMQAVAVAPGRHLFCRQTGPHGTGSAAKAGAGALQTLGYTGDVLVVAGDKALEETALRRLLDVFYATDCDMAFLVGDIHHFPTSGRVVCGDDGKVLGIVEAADAARATCLRALSEQAAGRPVPAGEALALVRAQFRQEAKAALALGALWERLQAGQPVTREVMARHIPKGDGTLRLNGISLSPEAVAGARYANLSVYLFRAPALYAALDRLEARNAQQEEYLTDVVALLAADGCRIEIVPTETRQEVMGFNTPEELAAIERHLASRRQAAVTEPPRALRLAREWLASLTADGAAARRGLAAIYGPDNPRGEDRRRLFISLLKGYLARYGNQAVVLSRAPGRLNIMGRHVDHQGGHVNALAIDRDFCAVVGARPDRQVCLSNLEPGRFSDEMFDMDGLMAGWNGAGWQAFVDSAPVRAQAAAAQGHWSQYVRAALARWQAEWPDQDWPGLNITAAGNVPVAAGLSSSSAIVVAVMEALAALHGMPVGAEQIVELCGEGEWYVGTRGGAGDHAAIKFGRPGHIARMGFFPFHVAETVPLPPGYLFLVANSGRMARKTAGAKAVFNHRVACYHLGREWLKQEHPQYADRIEHLRDVSTAHLGLETVELLGMLRRLPNDLTRDEAVSRFSTRRAADWLASHAEHPDRYPLRGVVMFGLAECERSRRCAGLLRAGEIEAFGRWMNRSHDGDRLVVWEGDGARPGAADYSDAAMDALIAASAREGADLAAQPGGYGCSLPEIDRMVDIALEVEGVAGAQIAGAGLGGCMMALVREEACESLQATLARRYYAPQARDPEMIVCRPAAGSGVLCW